MPTVHNKGVFLGISFMEMPDLNQVSYTRLYHRYNVIRVLGDHDAHAIIPHTAGWMVVYYKLMAT